MNDEWTLIDKLGYSVIVNNIINTIDSIEPPFTIGLYGGWGSGKTSLMKQVYYKIGGTTKTYLFPFNQKPEEEDINQENLDYIKRISDKKDYETIWFNPWKHELESNPLLGLLHEIREHFNLYNKTSTSAKKLANVTVRSGLDILTNTIKELTKIDISPSSIEKYGEKYESNNFETKSNSQNFRLIFESAIKKLLSTKKEKKLIIFIDDLDRCTDQKIIKLLEGIKLYLSTSNCIFIFGMDQSNVSNALKNHNINQDYLDKLFQSVIRIPTSTQYQTFITSTIIEKYFNDFLDEKEKPQYAQLLMDINERNPRKIKNFANSLKFYWDIKGKESLDLKIFTLFHYLRINYENIFEVLERDFSQYHHLVSICNQEPPSSTIGSFFYNILHNPLTESIIKDNSNEGAIVNKTYLNQEEITNMHNVRIKFKALDNFKSHFAEKCTSKIESDLKYYLGVICCEEK